MGNPPGIANAAKLAEQEGEFRSRAMGFLSVLLNPGTPDSLRAMTVIMISLFVFISFEICIMLIHAIVAHVEHARMGFAFYQYSILSESGCGLGSGFFLVVRMSSFERAKKLEENFVAMQEAKQMRRKASSE